MGWATFHDWASQPGQMTGLVRPHFDVGVGPSGSSTSSWSPAPLARQPLPDPGARHVERCSEQGTSASIHSQRGDRAGWFGLSYFELTATEPPWGLLGQCSHAHASASSRTCRPRPTPVAASFWRASRIDCFASSKLVDMWTRVSLRHQLHMWRRRSASRHSGTSASSRCPDRRLCPQRPQAPGKIPRFLGSRPRAPLPRSGPTALVHSLSEHTLNTMA